MESIIDIKDVTLDHNRMGLTLLMASLMANDLDSTQVHAKLIETKPLLLEKADSLPGSLNTPLIHAACMIDFMRTKGGAAYTFFFDPQEFSIEKLLEIGVNGARAFNEGLNLGVYEKADLLALFNAIKDIVKEVNSELEEQQPLYLSVMALLVGFISDAENAE